VFILYLPIKSMFLSKLNIPNFFKYI